MVDEIENFSRLKAGSSLYISMTRRPSLGSWLTGHTHIGREHRFGRYAQDKSIYSGFKKLRVHFYRSEEYSK